MPFFRVWSQVIGPSKSSIKMTSLQIGLINIMPCQDAQLTNLYTSCPAKMRSNSMIYLVSYDSGNCNRLSTQFSWRKVERGKETKLCFPSSNFILFYFIRMSLSFLNLCTRRPEHQFTRSSSYLKCSVHIITSILHKSFKPFRRQPRRDVSHRAARWLPLGLPYSSTGTSPRREI